MKKGEEKQRRKPPASGHPEETSIPEGTAVYLIRAPVPEGRDGHSK